MEAFPIRSPATWFVARRPNDPPTTITIMESASGNDVARVDVAADSVRSATISPNGRFLAVVTESKNKANAIQLWDIPSRKLRETLEGHDAIVGPLAFSPDNTHLVAASRPASGARPNFARERIQVWDAQDGKLLTELPESGLHDELKFSDDGRFLLGTRRNGIAVWDYVDAQAALAAIWNFHGGVFAKRNSACGR